MKKLMLSQMEQIEGGKFWGTGTVTSCVINPLSGNPICQTCNQDYMLWIKVGSRYNCHDSTPLSE